MSGIRSITDKPEELIDDTFGDLYGEVIEELREDYNINLTAQEVNDAMEEYGIDFDIETDYSVADLIAEYYGS